MNEKQADAAASAILEPEYSRLQENARKNDEKRLAALTHKKRRAFALSAAVLGGTLGTLLSGSLRPGGVLGIALGAIFGIALSYALFGKNSSSGTRS